MEVTVVSEDESGRGTAIGISSLMDEELAAIWRKIRQNQLTESFPIDFEEQ